MKPSPSRSKTTPGIASTVLAISILYLFKYALDIPSSPFDFHAGWRAIAGWILMLGLLFGLFDLLIARVFQSAGNDDRPDSYTLAQAEIQAERKTKAMITISETAAKENLACPMDKVCRDHTPVIITRERDQSVVMISLEEYASLDETAYLLKHPKNAKRIMSAIDQLDAGKGIKRTVDLNV